MLTLVWLMTGCAGFQMRFGKIVPVGKLEKAMDIKTLEAGLEKYDVYSMGPDVATTSGVLFYPQDSEVPLKLDRWTKLPDQEAVLKRIRAVTAQKEMQFSAEYPPRLYKVIGPDDRSYGYLYTAWKAATIRLVDGRLAVGIESNPPFYHFVY